MNKYVRRTLKPWERKNLKEKREVLEMYKLKLELSVIVSKEFETKVYVKAR